MDDILLKKFIYFSMSYLLICFFLPFFLQSVCFFLNFVYNIFQLKNILANFTFALRS